MTSGGARGVRARPGERFARFLMERVKPRLMATRLMQNVRHDVSNTDEFGSLREHEKMLADAVRVDTYAAAIARSVRPEDVVLDLGTGSGILALLAARQGAKQVYAVDHSPFIGVARQIAAHNGIDTVTFVQGNSRSFTPPTKVDLVVHEQMGDDLFNENMVENLLDLKHRVLADGGRILPARFELYIEPVCLNAPFRVPYLWENHLHGLDYAFLRDSDDLATYKRTNYETHHLRDGAVSHFLAEPRPALTVDLDRLDSTDDLPSLVEESRPVVQAGTLDGFCVYFVAIFDEDTSFSTSPLATPTHWGNRLFRTPQRELALGDKLTYRVDLPDLTRGLTWSISPIPTTPPPPQTASAASPPRSISF